MVMSKPPVNITFRAEESDPDYYRYLITQEPTRGAYALTGFRPEGEEELIWTSDFLSDLIPVALEITPSAKEDIIGGVTHFDLGAEIGVERALRDNPKLLRFEPADNLPLFKELVWWRHERRTTRLPYRDEAIFTLALTIALNKLVKREKLNTEGSNILETAIHFYEKFSYTFCNEAGISPRADALSLGMRKAVNEAEKDVETWILTNINY